MKIEKVTFFLLVITAIMDTLNGFLLKSNYNISIGQIYRFILLITIIICIFKYIKKSNYTVYLFIIILYFIMSTLVTVFYHDNTTVLFNDLVTVSKLLLPILIIIAYDELYNLKKVSVETINKIIWFNILYIPISLIIPKMLNMGYSAYVGDSGYKGFYFSNNEINIVLAILFIFVWENVYMNINNKKVKLKDIFFIVYVFIPFILIGSKTSIITSIIVTLVYIFRIVKSSKNILRNIIIVIFLIIGSFCIVNSLFYNDIQSIIARQQYFYQSLDPISFILSDRNGLADALWNQVKGNTNIFTILFGYRKNLIQGNTTFLYLELDVVCIFLNYGIVGVLLIYSFYFKIFTKTKSNKMRFPYKFAFIIVVAFSTFAGHVMFSAIAGTFLGIISVVLNSDEKYERGKIYEDFVNK